MFKNFLVFAFLLVTISSFSQVKFMAGVSVNPNISISSQQGYNYWTGISMGGGATMGVYLCKKVFLLTGAELIATRQSYTVYNTYKTTAQQNFWDVPLLANYMLTDAAKKVSFFLTAGAAFGERTKQHYTSNDVGLYPSNATYTGKEIHDRGYAGAIIGAGCKVNLNEKLSLFVLPDYRGVPDMAEVRTMLMYNF